MVSQRLAWKCLIVPSFSFAPTDKCDSLSNYLLNHLPQLAEILTQWSNLTPQQAKNTLVRRGTKSSTKTSVIICVLWKFTRDLVYVRFTWGHRTGVNTSDKRKPIDCACFWSYFRHILDFSRYCREYCAGSHQPRSQSSSAISDVTSPVKLVGKIRLWSLG